MTTRMWIAAVVALIGAGATFADPPPTPAPANPAVSPPLAPPPPRDVASPPAVVVEDGVDRINPRFWFDANYLLYFLSPSRYPQPFLTTSPTASLGILGQNGTQVLIGGDVDYGTFNGLRIYSGGWLNEDHSVGSDGETIFLEQRSHNSAQTSDGTTLLARPLVNALNGSPASSFVAFPGFIAGSLVVESQAKFATTDGNILVNLVQNERSTVNLLAGYRYIYFREQVQVTQNQQFLTAVGSFLGAQLPTGAEMTISDRFECVNNLYLLQLGFNGETTRGCIVISGHAKLGIGWANERTFADGRTTQGGVTVPGGILVQTTFPYRNYNDRFVVVPNIGGQFGYQITQRWRFSAGYDFMYVSNVARPGVQIDPSINPNLVPSFPQFGTAGGPARPTFAHNVADLFAHGVQFGLTFRY